MIRVGLIGTGKMGRAHSFAYSNAGKFFPLGDELELCAVAGSGRESASRFASRFGWGRAADDWRELVESDEVDLIDICVPNDLHAEMAIAAAQRGKHIWCEKPLAADLDGALRMTEAVLRAEREAGIKHMVGFNYRFLPAVAYAKRLIERGAIGEVTYFEGRFLQDWLLSPQAPATWRLDRSRAGSGALGDLGSHVIDLARYLVGEIGEVAGMAQMFVAERPEPGTDRKRPVTVDDAASLLLVFAGGAQGMLRVSRSAGGHKCGHEFEISGTTGSLRFDFQRCNELQYYSTADGEDVQGFRTISVTRPGAHPYADGWWGPGHVLGFENSFVHLAKELADAIGEDRPAAPGFADGLRCQQVLDAAERSLRNRSWTRVADRIGGPEGAG